MTLEIADQCGFRHSADEILAMHNRIIELQEALWDIYGRIPTATMDRLERVAAKALHTAPRNTGSSYSQEG